MLGKRMLSLLRKNSNYRKVAWPATAALALMLAAGCGDGSDVVLVADGGAGDGGEGDDGSAPPDGEGFVLTPRDADPPADGAPLPPGCMPEGEQKHEVMESPHVVNNEGVQYTSNPPSSGPHCAQTVAYSGFDQPVSSCYWLHNLEHGGIVVLYNCPDGCNDIRQRIGQFLANVTDPDCQGTKRVIIAPEPTLDVKVAVVAWGYTWKSNCLDVGARTAMEAFANARIGSRGEAPEKTLCP
jgi:hypothetical protein